MFREGNCVTLPRWLSKQGLGHTRSQRVIERFGSFRRRARQLRTAVVAVSVLLSTVEAFRQHRETVIIEAVARQVVADAGASSPREKTVALRDYVRAHVTHVGAPYTDRPFLRATAAETLETGVGYCGEATRLFINLAAAEGIRAARMNLFGAAPHVVAYVDLGTGENVLVDSLPNPQVGELETIDALMSRHVYADYSTINLRRLHLESIFTRTKLTLGPLTYWGENPHAMKATTWALVAAMLLALRGLRLAARRLLQWRGWVHRSSLPAQFGGPARAPSEPEAGRPAVGDPSLDSNEKAAE
jgi:Transglutaminase-like superfamily